ncbi:hypothetical protein SAY86_012040 [Trapa natans]|uniref:PSMD12/CSN4-like N-terminal domain-containing protein n=1 Tax=Trapa natans TaxID=22666 RepID=A0AAN7MC45_TRANT|nr:hypothetical protein SAY86_012040 [Trapa natans]
MKEMGMKWLVFRLREGGRKPNKEEAFQPIKEETNRLVYSSQKFTRQRIEQYKLILASVLSSNDILQMKKAHYALAQIQPRVVSFEEQVLVIRETLAELYESEQQWSKAAQMLSVIKPRFRYEIVGICQALNDILDNMANKGFLVPL